MTTFLVRIYPPIGPKELIKPHLSLVKREIVDYLPLLGIDGLRTETGEMGETTKWKETYHNDYDREIRTMGSSTSDRIWKIT